MEEGKEVTEKNKPCSKVNEKEPTAIRKALQNDAVLRGIVRNFKSIEELKKFRTLNRKCFEIGTKALLDTEKSCEHLKGELQLNASMTEEQKEYLLRHGSDARRVSLDLGTMTKGSVETIRKIILDFLKKMDVLILRFTPSKLDKWLDDPTMLFQENDSLPNLRSVHLPLLNHIVDDDDGFQYERFRYILMPDFVGKLLKAAGNLEEIHNVDEDTLVVVNNSQRAEAVKLLSISDYRIWDEDEENGDQEHDLNIAAFASTSPKLTKLCVHEFYIQNPYLKAIVESSKETLRKIKISLDPYEPSGEKRTENFPVLPLILSADFVTLIKLHEYIGAQQFGLSFPNLEKVRVHADGWRYFQKVPVTGMFPTVRSLFMNFDPGNTACNFMNRLMKMFPSITSVKIDWLEFSKNWTTNAKVWNHIPKQVRRIRLYNFRLEKYDNYGLDRLLTGIPKNMCRDLQKLKKDAIDFDRWRTKPSISSLENLKSLKLYVGGGFKLEDTRIKNYWSQLSAWGALDDLRGFKLQFVLPEDLVRDGNFNEVKRLLQPLPEVSSVSFYKRKRQL